MSHRLTLLAGSLVLAAAALCACGGGSSISAPYSHPTVAPSPIGATGLHQKAFIAVPNLPAGGSFSYDIGAVDPTSSHYYLADRTNKSVDVFSTTSLSLIGQVTGFAGVGSSNATSGPDGVVVIPNTDTVYAGDVNRVALVSASSMSIVASIPTATSGKRSDEGCYDPDDNLVMFVNGEDTPPFASWIAVTGSKANTVVAKFTFSGAQFGAGEAGLDACLYDSQTKNFYVNNDGTTTNPTGELDVIPASTVVAGTPQVTAQYAQTGCNPSGLALNPANQILVIACDANVGSQQFTLVMNATNGSVVSRVTQVGGSDEIAYDPKLNHFYVAARDWTANGISVTGQTGAVFTPVLGVLDGSGNFLGNIPTGTGSHSVAADPTTGNVFVPEPPTASAAGGIAVFGP
ncbi:MAG TPA: hypothetical protein VFB22_06890 [Candidatus Baltobacteraceae bacterium]|nr:hypothetical protein [Candidatus Baltobacteraceae bacterium]